MQVFSGYQGLPPEAQGAVVALGNFDGVHRGHAAVLASAQDFARARGLKLAVLTFEPHPRRFFYPDDAPFRLTMADEKARHLEALGVDILYVLDFNKQFSEMRADQFQDMVLRDGLKAQAVVAGDNFRFGYRREGSLANLAARDPSLAIVTPAIARDAAGQQISSTLVRQALAAGQPRQAAALLGRWWEIDYVVETGDRRGRELGYPTANGRLGDLIRPAYGVYAVFARLADGSLAKGAANIGVRPMWRSDQPLVETFLFDRTVDLYDQPLRVALVDYLRPEAKFPDIDSLKRQMADDCDRARSILDDVAPYRHPAT